MFSSKKRTVVHTSVMRAIEEDQLPETAKSGLIEAIMSGHSVSDGVVEGLLNGPTLRVDRMYEYAKNHYAYGLPEGTVYSADDAFDAVIDVIEGIVERPITVDYYKFAPLNNTHMAWVTLFESYEYNHHTNEIEALTGTTGSPVYLDYIQAYHEPEEEGQPVDLGTREVWGTPPTGGYTPQRQAQQNGSMSNSKLYTDYIVEDGGEEAVRIYTISRNSDGDIERDSIYISLADYSDEFEYHQAKYSYSMDGETHHGYFTYKENEGTYPSIDNVFNKPVDGTGTYFPIAFFRNYRQNRTDSSRHDTEQYKTTEKLLSYLYMDYQDISDSIHENPDISDVEQAALMFAVPANAESQHELRYLFDYFKSLGNLTPDPRVTSAGTNMLGSIKNHNAVVIKDLDFNATLSYGAITRKLRGGSVGDVGEYNSTLTSFKHIEVVDRPDPSTGNQQDMPVRVEVTVPQWVYRKQVTKSMYEEIRVNNPTMRYAIWRGRSFIGGPDSDQLLIPLDKRITDGLSLLQKEELYFRALHFVFNSRVTERVSWYQTGAFKALITVAAVVLTVYTAGAAYGALAAAAAGATGVVAVAVAITWALIKMVVMSLAIDYSFRIVIREIGIEAAFIIAIAAAVASGGMALTDTDMVMKMTAENLLFASTGFSAGIETESQRLVDDYQSEAQEFNLMAEEKWEELEEVNNLLDSDSLLDPFTLINRDPDIYFGENPDDFYNRTVHSGNIGTLGIESVESYVDISLTLPKIESSLGDTAYE